MTMASSIQAKFAINMLRVITGKLSRNEFKKATTKSCLQVITSFFYRLQVKLLGILNSAYKSFSNPVMKLIQALGLARFIVIVITG